MSSHYHTLNSNLYGIAEADIQEKKKRKKDKKNKQAVAAAAEAEAEGEGAADADAMVVDEALGVYRNVIILRPPF